MLRVEVHIFYVHKLRTFLLSPRVQITISPLTYIPHWKCDLALNPPVRLLVGSFVGRSVIISYIRKYRFSEHLLHFSKQGRRCNDAMMRNHVAGMTGYWMYMGVSEKVRELGRSKCERVREEVGYRDSAALDRTERKLKVFFFKS